MSKQEDPNFLEALLHLDSKYERICIGFICLSRWVGGQIVQNMFEQVDFVKVSFTFIIRITNNPNTNICEISIPILKH
jgi:hypothetical protein